MKNISASSIISQHKPALSFKTRQLAQDWIDEIKRTEFEFKITEVSNSDFILSYSFFGKQMFVTGVN
jgi:hypothetical protein